MGGMGYSGRAEDLMVYEVTLLDKELVIIHRMAVDHMTPTIEMAMTHRLRLNYDPLTPVDGLITHRVFRLKFPYIYVEE